MSILIDRHRAPTTPPRMFDSYFTVYHAEAAIEIHPGCEDYDTLRVICTCVEYQQAYEVAVLVANMHHLPLKNFVQAA